MLIETCSSYFIHSSDRSSEDDTLVGLATLEHLVLAELFSVSKLLALPLLGLDLAWPLPKRMERIAIWSATLASTGLALVMVGGGSFGLGITFLGKGRSSTEVGQISLAL